MPNRKYGNQMELRQNVAISTATYDQLYGSKVMHFDAWLYQMPDDRLYFVLQTRAGGQQILHSATFRAEPGALIPDDSAEAAERGLIRYIGGAWAAKHAPWLDALHTRIRGEADRLRTAHARTSVKLWYVWTDRAIDDPTEGVENLHGITGYAGEAPAVVPAKRKASLWNAADRSKLRTLDKLLK